MLAGAGVDAPAPTGAAAAAKAHKRKKRKLCRDEEEEHAVDGMSITPYAWRAPKPRRTGNVARESVARCQREAFMKVITLLERDPDFVYPTYNYVVQLIKARESKDRSDDTETWNRRYSKVDGLPRSWIASRSA